MEGPATAMPPALPEDDYFGCKCRSCGSAKQVCAKRAAAMDKIKFGTDGWRGVIADDLTFANVRRVAAAVAQYVREESDAARGLIVGYDMRFLSGEFARTAAEVLSAAGIPVWLADAGTPTPAVSYAVVARRREFPERTCQRQIHHRRPMRRAGQRRIQSRPRRPPRQRREKFPGECRRVA